MMEHDWRWIFANRLDKLLDQRGLSSKDFAHMIGVTEVCVSFYLNGSRTPSIRTLLVMCDVLDCTMDELVM